jgi:hypothetical protein
VQLGWRLTLGDIRCVPAMHYVHATSVASAAACGTLPAAGGAAQQLEGLHASQTPLSTHLQPHHLHEGAAGAQAAASRLPRTPTCCPPLQGRMGVR